MRVLLSGDRSLLHETRQKHSVQTAAQHRCQGQKYISTLCKSQPFNVCTHSCHLIFLPQELFSILGFYLCKHAPVQQDWLCKKSTDKEEGQWKNLLQWRECLDSTASTFYLEIMELDCDWLEEMVAALS